MDAYINKYIFLIILFYLSIHIKASQVHMSMKEKRDILYNTKIFRNSYSMYIFQLTLHSYCYAD